MVEGKNRGFEELELPGEGLLDLEAPAEPGPSDDPDALPVFDVLPKSQSPADEHQPAESQEGGTEEDAGQMGGFLKALSNANPYTVILGVALAAILTACACLLLEWHTYGFDTDASDYKQRAE